MTLENNQFEENDDISQFLEKFKEHSVSSEFEHSFYDEAVTMPEENVSSRHSFEKLEQKIQELEEKFEVSASQNQLILSELAYTREVMDRQKDRDAFLQHLSRTIASLKNSVENLSRAQQRNSSYSTPSFGMPFGAIPASFGTPAPIKKPEPPVASEKMGQHTIEKDRVFDSLRQKASQLKAVNSALDREIKKVQQEKMEALRKSAEQAKEILSLREQLTAAEEKFKSFDFDDRIISVKQAYQQKVSSLETQLKEISDTCMQQVEEIESLKAENLKLNHAAQERDVLQSRLQEKERQVLALKQEMAALQSSSDRAAQNQLASFRKQLQILEDQRDGISVDLEQAQASLDSVRQEKEILEKNFQELLAKINGNDKVIEQLKQKIEVLGRQNETLLHNNKTLQEHNEALAKHTDVLETKSQQLLDENKVLQQQNETMIRAKRQEKEDQEKLSKYVARLNQEKHALEEVNENIAQENQQLRSQSAALLAAQLAHENEQEDLAKAKTRIKPSAPTAPTSRKPAAPKGGSFSVKPKKHASFAQEQDDLPEIKVAKIEPEPQLTDQADDFLTKTGSFFGRIKWSIFGEDK